MQVFKTIKSIFIHLEERRGEAVNNTIIDTLVSGPGRPLYVLSVAAYQYPSDCDSQPTHSYYAALTSRHIRGMVATDQEILGSTKENYDL